MTNVELIVQIKSIENALTDKEKPNKTILDFEVSSYSLKNGFNPKKLQKTKNTLLAFGNLSDFVVSNIKQDDYILIKGDLREVSSQENVFLPLSIEKVGDKKKSIKIKNSIYDAYTLC